MGFLLLVRSGVGYSEVEFNSFQVDLLCVFDCSPLAPAERRCPRWILKGSLSFALFYSIYFLRSLVKIFLITFHLALSVSIAVLCSFVVRNSILSLLAVFHALIRLRNATLYCALTVQQALSWYIAWGRGGGQLGNEVFLCLGSVLVMYVPLFSR